MENARKDVWSGKKMEIEIKPYYALPCSLEVFTINGKEADESDFGDSGDDSPGTAEPYGCGDHRFHGKMPTQKILDKYKISVDEYSTIVSELEEKLAVGSCGWCV